MQQQLTKRMERVFGSRCESLAQWGLDDASAGTHSRAASAERATRGDTGAVTGEDVPARPAAWDGESPTEPAEEFAFSRACAAAAPDAPTGLHIAAAVLADVSRRGSGSPLPRAQLIQQHNGQGAEAGSRCAGSQAPSEARLALHSAERQVGVHGLCSLAPPTTTTDGLSGALLQLRVSDFIT